MATSVTLKKVQALELRGCLSRVASNELTTLDDLFTYGKTLEAVKTALEPVQVVIDALEEKLKPMREAMNAELDPTKKKALQDELNKVASENVDVLNKQLDEEDLTIEFVRDANDFLVKHFMKLIAPKARTPLAAYELAVALKVKE